MIEKEKTMVKNVTVSKRMLIIILCVFAAFTILAGTVTGIICYNLAGTEYNVSIKSGSNYTPLTASESDVAAVVDMVADSVIEVQTQIVLGSKSGESAGSGVIISNNNNTAIAITNHHVISSAVKITAVLRNGTQYDAKLIASDGKADIAVIEFTASGLNTATFGNSEGLKVGQSAIAIGNPLGVLGGSVTNGIISATGRTVSVGGVNMNLLQTNAAINPGNSGGGLFNLSGELIGIVNAKSSGEDVEGIGFAIPSNTARDVAVQLLENGYVSGRASLGIGAAYLEASSVYGSTRLSYSGIYVTETDIDNLFHAGDYILQIGDVDVSAVTDVGTLFGVVNNHKSGDTIPVTVLPLGATSARQAETFTITLKDYLPA